MAVVMPRRNWRPPPVSFPSHTAPLFWEVNTHLMMEPTSYLISGTHSSPRLTSQLRGRRWGLGWSVWGLFLLNSGLEVLWDFFFHPLYSSQRCSEVVLPSLAVLPVSPLHHIWVLGSYWWTEGRSLPGSSRCGWFLRMALKPGGSLGWDCGRSTLHFVPSVLPTPKNQKAKLLLGDL